LALSQPAPASQHQQACEENDIAPTEEDRGRRSKQNRLQEDVDDREWRQGTKGADSAVVKFFSAEDLELAVGHPGNGVSAMQASRK